MTCAEIGREAAINELKKLITQKLAQGVLVEEVLLDDDVQRAGEIAERAGASIKEVITAISEVI